MDLLRCCHVYWDLTPLRAAAVPVCRAAAAFLPSLFQRWRRMEAVVMAEMEMRLMVGVTSTWSTLRPRGSSGALSGSEFFMAFPSWSWHTEATRNVWHENSSLILDWFGHHQKHYCINVFVWFNLNCIYRSYQERLGVKLQLGSVQNVLQGFPSHFPFAVVSTQNNTKHTHTGV